MALVNFALADGYIARFDAKYDFRFWRPITAIRRAAEDGNDATTADESWLPLPGVTRHYRSFTHAAWENGLSRVYGGIHFLRAVEDGFMPKGVTCQKGSGLEK